VILGAIIVLAFGAARITQLRMVARNARRQNNQGAAKVGQGSETTSR
jgi:isoprenylcysteine carboxyl methyltransferase (ICMT) family protein YpbQ